jgi:hypothetical protein
LADLVAEEAAADLAPVALDGTLRQPAAILTASLPELLDYQPDLLSVAKNLRMQHPEDLISLFSTDQGLRELAPRVTWERLKTATARANTQSLMRASPPGLARLKVLEARAARAPPPAKSFSIRSSASGSAPSAPSSSPAAALQLAAETKDLSMALRRGAKTGSSSLVPGKGRQEMTAEEWDALQLDLAAELWVTLLLGADPATKQVSTFKILPEGRLQDLARDTLKSPFLNTAHPTLSSYHNAYVAWRAWVTSDLGDCVPKVKADDPPDGLLPLYFQHLRDTAKRTSPMRAFNALKFAHDVGELLPNTSFLKRTKGYARVPRTADLKQAFPLEVQMIAHLEAWCSSYIFAVRTFALGACACLHSILRLQHMVRSRTTGKPCPVGLFCQAFKGKAKEGGAPTVLPWAMPLLLMSGGSLAVALYDALSKIGVAEGASACLLPSPRIKRGRHLGAATGFFKAPLTQAQFMRHLRHLLMQSPLNLTWQEAMAFTSYSLRRVHPTWADLRGLPLENRFRLADWREDPTFCSSGKQKSSSLPMPVRYSNERLTTACEEKVASVATLGEGYKACLAQPCTPSWENMGAFCRSALGVKPGPNVLGAGKPLLPELGAPPLSKKRQRREGALEILDKEEEEDEPSSPSSAEGNSSDSSSAGDCSDEEAAAEALTEWASQIPWFTVLGKGRLHWRGEPRKRDAPGTVRAVRGCPVGVPFSSVEAEGVGIASANGSGHPWCENCQRQALKTHPEAEEPYFA